MLLAGGMVDELPGDVEVPGVAGVLLEHVHENPSERRPPAGISFGKAASRRGDIAQLSFADDPPGPFADCMESAHQLGDRLLRSDVPPSGLVLVAIGCPDLLGHEAPAQPALLHVCEVFGELQGRPARRYPTRAQVGFREAFDLSSDNRSEVVEVAKEQLLGVSDLTGGLVRGVPGGGHSDSVSRATRRFAKAPSQSSGARAGRVQACVSVACRRFIVMPDGARGRSSKLKPTWASSAGASAATAAIRMAWPAACGTSKICSWVKTRVPSSVCTGTCCACSDRIWAVPRTKRSQGSSLRCGTSKAKPSGYRCTSCSADRCANVCDCTGRIAARLGRDIVRNSVCHHCGAMTTSSLWAMRSWSEDSPR